MELDVLSGVSSSSGKFTSSQSKVEVKMMIEKVYAAKEACKLTDDKTIIAESLNKMGDVFEEATESFYRRHPDPFDERAPHSIFGECKLGKIQKSLSEFPDFLDKIVEDYIIDSSKPNVNQAACRLLFLALPGFEVQPTFSAFGPRLMAKLGKAS